MRVLLALRKFDEAGEGAQRGRQAVIKAATTLELLQLPGEPRRVLLAPSCVELRGLRDVLEHSYLTMGRWDDATATKRYLPALPFNLIEDNAPDDESYLAMWESELKNYEGFAAPDRAVGISVAC